MNSQFEITFEEWHETSRDGAGIPIKLGALSQRKKRTQGKQTLIQLFRDFTENCGCQHWDSETL